MIAYFSGYIHESHPMEIPVNSLHSPFVALEGFSPTARTKFTMFRRVRA